MLVVGGGEARGERNGGVVYVDVGAIRGSFAFLSLGRVFGVGVGRGGGGDLERAVHGHGDGGDGAGARGGDDGGLRVFEEPPDGFSVGLVAQLSGQLEDPRGARRGHSDPPASAFYFSVAVLG